MFPILNPPPSSLPIPSLWVVPVHQPQACSILNRTWTGDSFHIYYTSFNAILPNHPTLSLSHRVHKTVLYISVSFAVFILKIKYQDMIRSISLPKLPTVPGGLSTSLVAQMVKNLPAMQETQFRSLGQEGPLEKRKGTHSSILA